MKILKGIPIFLIFSLLLGSCVDQPEFSKSPTFEITKIEFVDLPGVSDFDSLNIYLDFKDGDGDLGLDADNLYDIGDPYNIKNYFLENGDGEVQSIPTGTIFDNFPPIIRTKGNTGKLVTIRTRNKPGYEFLPPFSCEYYNTTVNEVYVHEDDLAIIDDTYNIIDTIVGTVNQETVKIYVVADTLYNNLNPNYFNIEVDWLVKNNDGSFTEFNWLKEFCLNFDGRFPVLNNSDKSRPLEGSLKYGMTSSGFVPLFSLKVLKLRITIRDRALNEYEAETAEFTLNEIKKN